MPKPDVKAADILAETTFRANKPRERTISVCKTPFAAEAIGPLTHGAEIVVLTRGEFSLVDAFQHILDETGPADMDVATWTAADADLRRAQAFIQSGSIRRMRWVVDPSFKSRKPAYCNELMRLFGKSCIRTVNTHAKFATIRNDDWHISVRTSMNLNPNPRMELIEISDDAALTGFFTSIVDSAFSTYSDDEAFSSQSRGNADRMFAAPTGDDFEELDF